MSRSIQSINLCSDCIGILKLATFISPHTLQRGLGPLHVAVLAEKHKMARILLRHQTLLKLDVNVKSKDVSYALWHCTVYRGQVGKVDNVKSY